MSAFNDPRLLKLERERREGPKCRECGYDLSGLTLVTPCPECGTARQRPGMVGRLDPQGAKILEVGRLELVRFQVGFGLVGVGIMSAPLLAIWGRMTAYQNEIAVGVAAVWAAGVCSLLGKRFAKAEGSLRWSESMRLLAVGTQWAWVVALILSLMGTAGLIWTVGVWSLVVIGALGSVGAFWEMGNLLEWAGDEHAGHRIRMTIPLVLGAVVLVAIGAFLAAYTQPLAATQIPLLLKIIFFVPAILLYIWLSRDVLSGVSIGHWARVQQVNDAGRTERIAAHRAAIESELASEVAERERAHQARHTKVDTSVSVDDFLD